MVFISIYTLSQVVVEADKAFEDCVYDVCNDLETGGNYMKTACSMTESFNKFCEESELGTTNWRSEEFCGKSCPTLFNTIRSSL